MSFLPRVRLSQTSTLHQPTFLVRNSITHHQHPNAKSCEWKYDPTNDFFPANEWQLFVAVIGNHREPSREAIILILIILSCGNLQKQQSDYRQPQKVTWVIDNDIYESFSRIRGTSLGDIMGIITCLCSFDTKQPGRHHKGVNGLCHAFPSPQWSLSLQ